MNWRHIAFLITSVIVLAVMGLLWINTYVYSTHKPSHNTPPKPTPTATSPARPANLTVTTYYYEEEGPYRFAIHYTLENIGGRSAKNIRITIRPWGLPAIHEPKLQQTPPSPELIRTSKKDYITKLGPKEKTVRVVSFDRPSGPSRALPSSSCYGDPFTFDFETE